MAKKKVSRKKVSKKIIMKRSMKESPVDKKKIVLKNLLLFAVLFCLSLVFYQITNGGFYKNLFYLTTLVTGSISLAFVIIFLTLFFLKLMKRNNF